ncbi:MAG: NADPH-dependent assimilatory sulfite reductase hemoprotein subunit [Ilumatobacteraceae bacterium]|nr:NADPH-dependent assimilatory sulfite reductase hemoprotein subunit [Ilumatobacteraceae bacterium]
MTHSDVEALKADSAHLRGSLFAELADDGASFSGGATTLLKFHGIYQQDDRDRRRELARAKEELAYSCMVRCSVPGGVLTRDQWFEIDRLADVAADGRLRLTTRQGVQFHFVHKGDLHRLVSELNRGLVTTYAACGDVVRNVMVTSAPEQGRDLDRLDRFARSLSSRFRPQSNAYWELWVDGERAVTGEAAATETDESEPIYGDAYLPRKFKIGVAWPGDNSVDVYSHDVGLVLAPGPDGTPGAIVLAGGGLGRSHTDDTTFPWLAEPLAWVSDDEAGAVVEAIVTTFRDEGNRDDRSHARLKYLVAEHGIGWLRDQVETRLGRRLADPVAVPDWGGPRDHLGWHRQDDDRWYLGVPIPTGRLEDTDNMQRRTAVRTVLERHAGEIRLTPHQDLLLCGIATADRDAVEAIFAEHHVPLARNLPLTVLSSMACPALPTCGQALGEAERILPELTDLIDGLLRERGLGDLRIETRVTGCPNGCARPYVAELGIVGRTKTAYDIFVGGDAVGTRLASLLVESVPLTKLGDVLAPLLDRYRSEHTDGEGFGDWTDRIGTSALAADLPDVATRRRERVGAS